METPKFHERRNFCMHSHFDVDRDLRTITCTKCSKQLDPFDVVVTFAREGGYGDVLRADRKKTAQTLAFLKGEERKVKARLKNANRKDADAAVAAERKKWKSNTKSAAWKAREMIELARSIQRLLGDKAEEPATP